MARTLTIRYTSDTHGYLYPTSYADMQDRPMGLMKLASEYPHDGNTLISCPSDSPAQISAMAATARPRPMILMRIVSLPCHKLVY